MSPMHAATSILGWLDVAYSLLARNIATASLLSLSSVVMDLWAMAALRSLRGGPATPGADRQFDLMMAFLTRILVVFAVGFVFAVGCFVLLGQDPSMGVRLATAVAGSVTVAMGLLLWFGLPPFQRMLDARARSVVQGRVPDGPVRRGLLGFLRFDLANPEVLSTLFYAKLLVLDALLLMYVVGRLATFVLGLSGVAGT